MLVCAFPVAQLGIDGLADGRTFSRGEIPESHRPRAGYYL
jgi:hypothetical protein